MADKKQKKTPEDWWSTSIIDMKPGMIRFRGYAIEELIGRVGFAEMVWLLTRGELPEPTAAKLLDAALVAAVDHGPQAPSIAVARMAVTCGVDINNAMASAINILGDVHGGAVEQCVAFYNAVARRIDAKTIKESEGKSNFNHKERKEHKKAVDVKLLRTAVEAEIKAFAQNGMRHVPGYGHRFHPTDPRAPRLLELVDEAAADGGVSGYFAAIGRMVEQVLARRTGSKIPMNIDGATGVIFAELGFPPPLCRGLFALSRSVGALAHAWEESQSGERNKGPIPRHLLWAYKGPKARPVKKNSRT